MVPVGGAGVGHGDAFRAEGGVGEAASGVCLGAGAERVDQRRHDQQRFQPGAGAGAAENPG